MRGLPKSYIKKYGVSKKAWREYRKSKGKKRKTSKSRSSNPKKRSVRKTARRKGRRRSRSLTVPLAVVGGLAPGMAPVVSNAMQGNFEGALHELGKKYTGFGIDGLWYPEDLKTGLGGLVVGLLVHKFVGGRPLNLNAMLARSGIPFIRI